MQYFIGKIGILATVTFAVACITANFVLVSGWTYAPYWYSQISKYVESPWLKYGSFVVQLISVAHMGFSFTLVEIPVFGFARAIRSYLRVNSYTKSEKISSKELATAVKKYEEAQRLMSGFNWLFKWVLFGYKVIAAAETCCFSFIILRVARQVPVGTVSIFYFVAIFFMTQLCILVPLVGSVYAESEGYIRSWKTGIVDIYDQIDPALRRRLANLSPFGFQCGSFYVIVPSTILTLLSVITTYLIVLLQV